MIIPSSLLINGVGVSNKENTLLGHPTTTPFCLSRVGCQLGLHAAHRLSLFGIQRSKATQHCKKLTP